MPSGDKSSDSETVQMTLQNSGPQISGPGILSPWHPAEIAPNTPINDIDMSIHSPYYGEAPLPTSSVESQPNTASAILQGIHNYIDSQLIDLVGVSVEQVVSTSYNKLADSISKEIGSIRKQIFQSTQEEDDPMSPWDQWNDNFVDGDDESEEHNGNHWQNWENQHRNNCHKWQQMMDDNEEDESDNGPILRQSKWAPASAHFSTKSSTLMTG